MGDPDQPHAYSYTPDVAAGLAVLGERPEAVGQVWHLPVAWKGTTRGLIDRFVGEPASVRTLPRWLFRIAGVFSPELRGVPEMIYQFETPYALDDTRFCQAFGVRATPIEVAVRATLAAHDPGRAVAATSALSPDTSS
jgi:nucleoside-diphosphate-sugar epimerase